MLEAPSLAVTTIGLVEAGCGGSDARHAPLGDAVAVTPATGCSPPSDATESVTLAPGAAQPQTEAGSGARCSTMPSE